MDDRQERKAALESLSCHKNEIFTLCKETVDMLDAFEELKIISEEEKEDANDREDYSDVVKKLQSKIENDPNFFEHFCSHIQNMGDLKQLAEHLLGEFKGHKDSWSLVYTSRVSV